MIAKKPIQFLTNAINIAQQLSRRRRSLRNHQHLIGGRAGPVAKYTRKFCEEIVVGFLAQKEADKMGMRPAGVMHLKNMNENLRAEVHRESKILH